MIPIKLKSGFFKPIYFLSCLLLIILGVISRPVPLYAQDYFKMGVQEQERANLDKAIEYYGLALKQDSGLLGAYVKRGLCYQDLSEFDLALRDFKKANELKPGDPDIEMSTGTTFFHLKDYQNALLYLTEALKKMPDNANAQFDLGLTKNELKDYKGALEAFDKAINLDPNKSQFYYCRALSKDKLRDFNGAIEDCNSSIKLKHDYEKAYYLRAKEENESKLFDKALADLSVVIKMNPKNSKYYSEKGSIEYHMGLLLASINDCDTAISINSLNGEPFFNRALSERDSGLVDSANADINVANKLFKGKSPFVFMESAKINIYLGDYAKAAKAAENALKINPKFIYAQYEVAYSEHFLGNDTGASKILNQIIKSDSSFTLAYWLLGDINYYAGDTSSARILFVKGSLSKGDPIGIAYCYAFMRDEEKAVTLMQAIIRFDDSVGLRIKSRDALGDMAYVYGVTKNAGKFFQYINEALEAGYANKAWIENSKELDYVRSEPFYKQLAGKYHLRR
jgi:tetratricopeptide (TPR) repeat protein